MEFRPMSPDEIERTVQVLLNQQAQFTADMASIQSQQAQFAAGLARMEETCAT